MPIKIVNKTCQLMFYIYMNLKMAIDQYTRRCILKKMDLPEKYEFAYESNARWIRVNAHVNEN